jgi:hypothetical protein
MKKILIVTIASLTGLMSVARATLIASESFETAVDGAGGMYVSGNIYNQDVVVGNTGFNTSNVWVNNTGAIKANVSDNTAYWLDVHSGISGSTGTTHGVALITSGYTRNSNRLLAATPATASSYYFSGVGRMNGVSVLDNGDKMAMGMMDQIASSSFDISTGIHIGYYRENDVNYLAAFAGGNAYNLLELAGGLVGNLYQVVLKLDVDASGNETLTVWYAADGDLVLTLGLAATDVGDIWQDAGDLDTFTLQTEEGGESNVQIGRFDEMRFGTSLSDVTQSGLPSDLEPEYIALTDSYSVELFSSNGIKTATFSLTGSGAVDGTNLISVAYGDFRGNGNELIVLRDSTHIEYYPDPLTASGGNLARLTVQSLEAGGRAVSGISMVAGTSNLVACANPDVNAGTYGYEYDGSLAGDYLARIATPVLTTYGRHMPYISLAAGDDLHSALGQDWAFLGEDGFVEIFTETNDANQAIERVAYFSVGSTATEIAVTDDDLYAFLYEGNTIQFYTLAGALTGSPVTLTTDSTLVGFAVPVKATVAETYDVWAASFGSIGSETDDFDGDGLDNLYEYASDGDPTDAADSGYAVSAQIMSTDSTNWFEYVYARRTTVGCGLTYTLVQNTNLLGGSWINTGEAVEVGAGVLDDDFEAVTNHIPMVGKTQEFISHQISK